MSTGFEYDFSQHETHHYEKYEYSYGMIAVNESLEKILIVKGRNHFWGFPKGHQNDKETELQTVEREMKEELDLDIVLNSENILGKVSFKFAHFYSRSKFVKILKEKIKCNERPYWNKTGHMIKKCVFYIIQLPEHETLKKIRAEPKEILDYDWITWSDAEKLFSETKSLALLPLIEAKMKIDS